MIIPRYSTPPIRQGSSSIPIQIRVPLVGPTILRQSAYRHHPDDTRPRSDNLDFRDVRLKPLTSRGFSPAVISAPVVIACEGRPCSTPGSPVARAYCRSGFAVNGRSLRASDALRVGKHDRVGLDLDLRVGVDQTRDLDHRRCGANLPEHRAMRRRDLLPPGDVGHEHARADHLLEPPAERLERRPDDLERSPGLLGDGRCVRPVGVDADRAGDGDQVPGAHGARVADDRLPPGARAGTLPAVPLAHRDADVAPGSATLQMPPGWYACRAA